MERLHAVLEGIGARGLAELGGGSGDGVVGEIVGLAGLGLLVDTADQGQVHQPRDAETELVDLVGLGLERVRCEASVVGDCEIRGAALHLDHHPGRAERRDRPGDGVEFGLPARRQHRLRGDVVDVMPRVAEVIAAKDHDLDRRGRRRDYRRSDGKRKRKRRNE